jgi:antitoxin component YwqK of YwqJK toxin-antitoxin module
VLLALPMAANAQYLIKTYYDEDKTNVKEEFYVRSKTNTILDGSYKSFFEESGIKSEGQFSNNVSTGIWKYYYKNGRLRMQGQVGNGKNIGQWEYFFETGSIKMVGTLINGKKDGPWIFYHKNGSIESEGSYFDGLKTGYWKYFHASGVLKATEDFSGDGSYYEEMYESGSLKREGKRINGNKVGDWKFFYEDGTDQVIGGYILNKRNGNWRFYNNMGKLESEGHYKNDLATGIWIYYHFNGSVASVGTLVEGKKDGNWQMFFNDGTLKGEVNYELGDGDYVEYYKSGEIKVQGSIKSGNHDGEWNYFYENGNKEGSCNFVDGEGDYTGYYNDGTIKMKGHLKNDLKTGIWELFEQSGELTGYYKPYYEDGEAVFFIAEEEQKQKALSKIRRAKAGSFKVTKKKSRYFRKKFHEYKALIIGYNPIAPLVGSLPLSFEYYLEERLGYELVAQYLRNPFFRSFSSVNEGTTYTDGFAVSFRQKFYHKEIPFGQPYFAHELKYTALFHGTNIAGQQVHGAQQQKIEYAAIIGSRYFKNVTANGFTADAYVGFGVGYRLYDQSFVSTDPVNDPFNEINSNNFAYSIRIGVNLGYAFRIKR